MIPDNLVMNLLHAAKSTVREMCAGCRWSPPDGYDEHRSELAVRPCTAPRSLREAIEQIEMEL